MGRHRRKPRSSNGGLPFQYFSGQKNEAKRMFLPPNWHRNQCDQIGRFIGLGQVLKPLTTINLPKSPTLLCNFLKVAKIFNFYSTIIFWQLFIDIWRFFSGHTERNFNWKILSKVEKETCYQSDQIEPPIFTILQAEVRIPSFCSYFLFQRRKLRTLILYSLIEMLAK